MMIKHVLRFIKTNRAGESVLGRFLMSLSRPVCFMLLTLMMIIGYVDPIHLVLFFKACSQMPLWMTVIIGVLVGVDGIAEFTKPKDKDNGEQKATIKPVP